MTPEDLVSRIDSLPVHPNPSLYEVDFLQGWARPTAYLEWAQECLRRDDEFGRDAAVCYAKRAVCRQIDGLLTANHLGAFVGKKYTDKLDILTAIGLDDCEVVHELVIDPRNEVEHSYTSANTQEAKRAVQVANMYLKSTAEESARGANVAINWCLSSSSHSSCKPGHEFERVEFTLHPDLDPMFLLDCEKPNGHVAMILLPRKSELDYCPLSAFNLNTAKGLAIRLRRQQRSPNLNVSKVEQRHFTKMKADLNFPACS